VNNLRDLTSVAAAGKRTLAVRLGDERTRLLYAALVAGAFVLAVLAAVIWRVEVLLALAAVVVAFAPVRAVLAGARGAALIGVLGQTGRMQLAFGALAAVGLALGG
jgi:1,4-dihydroxy-2-naphthoate octaprenyltransferase